MGEYDEYWPNSVLRLSEIQTTVVRNLLKYRPNFPLSRNNYVTQVVLQW